MHDIKWIRENPQAFDAAMARRGRGVESPTLLKLDELRRRLVTEIQQKQERRNAASKEIGKAMGAKDMALADSLKAEVSALKDEMTAIEAQERTVTAELELLLASIPNIPLGENEVPNGKDENDNRELRKVGTPRTFDFAPAEHFDLGEKLGMMDFEAAAKMSGARFTILKGGLAKLERALGQFMIDLHTEEHGYTEVMPPLLVKDDAMFGTGQLPKFKEDLFEIPRLEEYQARTYAEAIFDFAHLDNERPEKAFRRLAESNGAKSLSAFQAYLLEQEPRAKDFAFEAFAKEVLISRDQTKSSFYLIPTSEVPLTNMVREDIQEQSNLPLRYTALTPCFRSEAGSAGRDTRGIIRQHQFFKVELVSITTPEQSMDEHERMTRCAEKVLELLGLPFRTIVLCTGDMGFGAQKTHDIEVWLPGQARYREISSISVCGDFQARRMNARYRPDGEKGTKFVHTLNGSGVAVGRCLIAVIENYQNEDGSITIPEVLRPYMRGMEKIG
jgi:seryl-tRNA synthetase